MANFVYKKSEVKSMKAVGVLNLETMTMTIDGADIPLKTLLKDFDGEEFVMNNKTKTEEELDLPNEE